MVLRIVLQIGILTLLVGSVVAPFSIAPRGVPLAEAQAIPTATPDEIGSVIVGQAVPSEACHGDEVISFAPPDAMVGQEMIVTVSSATSHSGVYMAGTERLTTATETTGQLGRVWLWSFTPQIAGPHRFQLFVDFTKFCKEATFDVAANPLATLNPLTSFPTPIPFPLTDGSTTNDNSYNSNSDNDDDNDNDDDDNDNLDDGNGNDGNLNDNIETIRQPIIDTVSCGDNRLVTITGRRFGSSLEAAAGKVLVQKDSEDPVEVTTYLKWSGSEIDVIVPNTGGKFTSLYVVNSAGFDVGSLDGHDGCPVGGLSTKSSR